MLGEYLPHLKKGTLIFVAQQPQQAAATTTLLQFQVAENMPGIPRFFQQWYDCTVFPST